MKGFRHWRWHLDEVYVKINGEMHYLWRAVDHEGEVLESYVTKTRDKAAALRFMRKTLKRGIVRLTRASSKHPVLHLVSRLGQTQRAIQPWLPFERRAWFYVRRGGAGY